MITFIKTTSFVKSSIFIKTSTVKETSFIETENDSSINRISFPKVIIPVRRELIISSKETFFARKTPFIATPRIAIINEYRSFYIDIKNAIVFASLKIKKFYDTRH